MSKVTFPPMKGDSSRDTNQLFPTCKILFLAAMKECYAKGIPIMSGEIQRSNKAQHADFLAGRSQLDAGESCHQWHSAVDTFTNPKKTGGQLYHRPTLQAAAVIFKSYGMIWGGDWDNDGDLKDNKFNDWPHFQFVSPIKDKSGTSEQDRIKHMTYDQIEAFYQKKFASILKRIAAQNKKVVKKK